MLIGQAVTRSARLARVELAPVEHMVESGRGPRLGCRFQKAEQRPCAHGLPRARTWCTAPPRLVCPESSASVRNFKIRDVFL